MADDVVLERRRARLEAAPALLRGGFRLFFLGGAAWAGIALLLWLLAFAGVADLRTAFDPLAWHRHELLFGFGGDNLVGYPIAASPNWARAAERRAGKGGVRRWRWRWAANLERQK